MTSLSKQQTAEIVRLARFRAGVTWTALAECIDKPQTWTVAALLGQHPMSAQDANAVGQLLSLEPEAIESLQMQPYRGSADESVRADPTIYRFYEALGVYGPALKELIHEEFGDGIMSAINFKIDVQRRQDPSGDRVVITMDGKFLDYNW